MKIKSIHIKNAVSYTHLDVYKRQVTDWTKLSAVSVAGE